MKANELMINDWVDWYRSPLLREGGHYYDKVIALDRYEQECKPIPLTAEILEKNGFVKNYWSITGEERWNFILDYGDDRIGFSRDLTGLSIYLESEHWLHLNSINYVHELQHALRLCGLNDLADNFKI